MIFYKLNIKNLLRKETKLEALMYLHITSSNLVDINRSKTTQM